MMLKQGGEGKDSYYDVYLYETNAILIMIYN